MANSKLAAPRVLGNSDLRVSPIGLGCWQFSKHNGMIGKFWPLLENKEIDAIVRVSLAGGINWFDTAESYGWGESEQALSRGLKAVGATPAEVIVATKWWPAFRTAKSIPQTIGQRLQALAGYRIDLYQVHQPFSFSSVAAEMQAMARLVLEHKVRFIGVSNYSARQMQKAQRELERHGLKLVSNQVRYSLLDRRIESNGVLQTAQELNVAIIAYSPLAQGLLTGRFHDQPESIRATGVRKYMPTFQAKGLKKSQPVIAALKNLAAKYQVSPAQIALNWLIHFHGDRVFAIPGATREQQARDNVGAMRFQLERSELEWLDQESTVFKY